MYLSQAEGRKGQCPVLVNYFVDDSCNEES